MNKEKQTLSESEQIIRTNIFNLEKLSKRTAIKAGIEKAKISLRIAQNAIESQDPKTLLRGFFHCNEIQKTMRILGVDYSEIESTKEEIEFIREEIKLKREDILQRTPILITAEVGKGSTS